MSVLDQCGEPALLLATGETGDKARAYRLVQEPDGPGVAHQECRSRAGKQLNVNL